MLDLLKKQFKSATLDQLNHGLTWYGKANSICLNLSKKHDLPLYKVVGVMSALSPRNKWSRNIKDTESVILHGMSAKVCTFNPNKEKAVKILDALTPAEVVTILNGRKVVSFFNNILLPDAPSTVTVDVWAMRSVGLNRAPNKTLYNQVEQAYKELGEAVGLFPHEAQAVIWGVVREKEVT